MKHKKDSIYCNGLSVSSGVDNGANDYMAIHFSRNVELDGSQCIIERHPQYKPLLRHSNTSMAIENLIGNTRPYHSRLSLCGHGNRGYFETGNGQSGHDINKGVGLGNPWIWNPLFNKLGSVAPKGLVIYSCSTGAGKRGRDLLHEIAVEMKYQGGRIYPVLRALTGLLFIDSRGNFTTQPGTRVQTGKHWSLPPVIDEPKVTFDKKDHHIYLRSPETLISSFEKHEIILCTITYNNNKEVDIPLSQKESQEIGRIIFNSSVQKKPGEILGVLTMKLKFQISYRKRNLTVEIYNDLAAIINSEQLLFYLPNNFRKLINI